VLRKQLFGSGTQPVAQAKLARQGRGPVAGARQHFARTAAADVDAHPEQNFARGNRSDRHVRN